MTARNVAPTSPPEAWLCLQAHDLELVPSAVRAQAEATFGPFLEDLMRRAQVRKTDLAACLAIDRKTLDDIFAGDRRFNAAWIASLPHAMLELYARDLVELRLAMSLAERASGDGPTLGDLAPRLSSAAVHVIDLLHQAEHAGALVPQNAVELEREAANLEVLARTAREAAARARVERVLPFPARRSSR